MKTSSLIGAASIAFILSNGFANAAVIEQMTTSSIGGSTQTYGQYGNDLMVIGDARVYFLDDGSSWSAGAGSSGINYSSITSYYIEGTTINYVLDTTVGTTIFDRTDYDSGDHSSQGTLASTDNLILTAEIGSTEATLSGWAEITSNTETWYGEPRFNYFAADVGELVKFNVIYTLMGSYVWDESVLAEQFTYQINGLVDFTTIKPVPVPATVWLFGSGLLGLMGVARRKKVA